jgi:deoxyribodipyrimidine photo-lyase
MNFPTDYASIMQRVQTINPIAYSKTRNYVDGAVTCLSPYLSRGVISTRQVYTELCKQGYSFPDIETLVKELSWRDYFQRVWQHVDINRDIKHDQQEVMHHEVPLAVVQSETGILGIDEAIKQLYQTGYMHNHCRMYTAALSCNISGAYWLQPARWMYYHLLDGDWASNACSWQWVAGCNSHKKYVADQENISRFTKTAQQQSFLQVPYEALHTGNRSAHLIPTTLPSLVTNLPNKTSINFNSAWPVCIYNYYNLDPLWHANEQLNRVLLIEPSLFENYPVSEKCIHFMLKLSENIEGIQVYIGTFQDFIIDYSPSGIYYKEHPLNKHYSGIEESRDWISPATSSYFPSFSAYWKKAAKTICMS